jgi:hypothetical protein
MGLVEYMCECCEALQTHQCKKAFLLNMAVNCEDTRFHTWYRRREGEGT